MTGKDDTIIIFWPQFILFYFSSSILVLFVVNQLLVSMEMSYAFNLFLFEAKKSLK